MTRIYARNLFDAHMILCHESMTHDINFICARFGDFMIYGYEVMNDNKKSQNDVWMTSWMNLVAEKLRRARYRYDQYDGEIWSKLAG